MVYKVDTWRCIEEYQHPHSHFTTHIRTASHLLASLQLPIQPDLYTPHVPAMDTASHLNAAAGPSRVPTSATLRNTSEDSICATWARDVARATTTTTTTTNTTTRSSHSTSRRVVASAPRASTSASPSTYPTTPPRRGRTTSNGSATSSARSSTTTSSTTTAVTSATSASTASSECDTFIASLPAMTMFGSVRPRGGQSLEERHLSIELESAQVCFARRI